MSAFGGKAERYCDLRGLSYPLENSEIHPQTHRGLRPSPFRPPQAAPCKPRYAPYVAP